VEFRIEERRRRVDLDGPPPLKKRNQYDRTPPPYRVEATGALRLACLSPHFYNDPARRSWYDQGRSKVEDKIPNILWRFQQLATRTVREKAEAEKAERQRREREHRAHELSMRRGHQAQLIAELERQAGAWYRAKLLQRYLRALRGTAGEGRALGTLGDQKVDFLVWAEQYVKQLNPLSMTPRNPDQQQERSNYWHAEENDLKKLLFRLFGCDGQLPWKLTAPAPAAETGANVSEDEDDEYELEDED
jgi:hypothetical protein